jgi:hypothetical protein
MIPRIPRAIAAVALITAVPAAPAAAADTSRTVVADFTESYAFVADCSDFGDYAFSVAAVGEQHVRLMTVTDAEGTLLQTVVHSSFSETDTNSVTLASLPLAGTMHELIDHVSGTRTVRGNIARGTQPGEGTYFQESGRIVFFGRAGTVLSAAGRHDAVALGGIDASMCAALAPG